MTNRIMSSRTNSDFLSRLKEGDLSAWAQLVREFSPRLYRLIRFQVPSEADAEDVLSETWLTVLKSIKDFEENAALSTYLYSMTKRCIMEFYRKRRHTAALTDNFSIPGPQPASLVLQEALQKLPEQHRQALLWRYQHGLTVSEISEKLGHTYKSTESLLSRARHSLQEQLRVLDSVNDSVDTTSKPHSSGNNSRYQDGLPGMMKDNIAMSYSMSPIALEVRNQQHKCEKFGSKEEAAIFERYVGKLTSLVE